MVALVESNVGIVPKDFTRLREGTPSVDTLYNSLLPAYEHAVVRALPIISGEGPVSPVVARARDAVVTHIALSCVEQRVRNYVQQLGIINPAEDFVTRTLDAVASQGVFPDSRSWQDMVKNSLGAVSRVVAPHEAPRLEWRLRGNKKVPVLVQILNPFDVGGISGMGQHLFSEAVAYNLVATGLARVGRENPHHVRDLCATVLSAVQSSGAGQDIEKAQRAFAALRTHIAATLFAEDRADTAAFLVNRIWKDAGLLMTGELAPSGLQDILVTRTSLDERTDAFVKLFGAYGPEDRQKYPDRFRKTQAFAMDIQRQLGIPEFRLAQQMRALDEAVDNAFPQSLLTPRDRATIVALLLDSGRPFQSKVRLLLGSPGAMATIRKVGNTDYSRHFRGWLEAASLAEVVSGSAKGVSEARFYSRAQRAAKGAGRVLSIKGERNAGPGDQMPGSDHKLILLGLLGIFTVVGCTMVVQSVQPEATANGHATTPAVGSATGTPDNLVTLTPFVTPSLEPQPLATSMATATLVPSSLPLSAFENVSEPLELAKTSYAVPAFRELRALLGLPPLSGQEISDERLGELQNTQFWLEAASHCPGGANDCVVAVANYPDGTVSFTLDSTHDGFSLIGFLNADGSLNSEFTRWVSPVYLPDGTRAQIRLVKDFGVDTIDGRVVADPEAGLVRAVWLDPGDPENILAYQVLYADGVAGGVIVDHERLFGAEGKQGGQLADVSGMIFVFRWGGNGVVVGGYIPLLPDGKTPDWSKALSDVTGENLGYWSFPMVERQAQFGGWSWQATEEEMNELIFTPTPPASEVGTPAPITVLSEYFAQKNQEWTDMGLPPDGGQVIPMTLSVNQGVLGPNERPTYGQRHGPTMIIFDAGFIDEPTVFALDDSILYPGEMPILNPRIPDADVRAARIGLTFHAANVTEYEIMKAQSSGMTTEDAVAHVTEIGKFFVRRDQQFQETFDIDAMLGRFVQFLEADPEYRYFMRSYTIDPVTQSVVLLPGEGDEVDPHFSMALGFLAPQVEKEGSRSIPGGSSDAPDRLITRETTMGYFQLEVQNGMAIMWFSPYVVRGDELMSNRSEGPDLITQLLIGTGPVSFRSSVVNFANDRASWLKSIFWQYRDKLLYGTTSDGESEPVFIWGTPNSTNPSGDVSERSGFSQ